MSAPIESKLAESGAPAGGGRGRQSFGSQLVLHAIVEGCDRLGSEDPAEEHNLFSANRDDAARLGAQLDARLADWASWEGETGTVTPEEREEIERRLEDLGYI